MQFTVEVIGGKPADFSNCLNGKLTCIIGELCVIPMALGKNKNDPLGADDDKNSYMAFKNSHPNC